MNTFSAVNTANKLCIQIFTAVTKPIPPDLNSQQTILALMECLKMMSSVRKSAVKGMHVAVLDFIAHRSDNNIAKRTVICAV